MAWFWFIIVILLLCQPDMPCDEAHFKGIELASYKTKVIEFKGVNK